jgi:hypothetical protein
VFKNVEYAGFEKGSELEAKARQANEFLGSVIRRWQNEVNVTWRPNLLDSSQSLELTLALSLWNASGTATGQIRQWAFDPGEEGELRSDIRTVWSDLLALLSDQQMKRLDEMLQDPVEA